MASPLQQQSLQRKLIYLGLIVVLFSAAYFWRVYRVEAKANQLSLREENRGEVELSGRAVNLLLTGSRGVVVCGLYLSAQEKQKKQQWNELELVVRSVLKLQPHFVEPLLHEGWNIAYNVSVECHDLRDMYFYISRGIELLAEGERRDLHQPKIRSAIAVTYQHKICESDKTSTMRSLFQLSCIDPVKRSPARFQLRTPEGEVLGPTQAKEHCRLHPEDKDAQRRLAEIDKNFEDFCREHAQLMRRLHDGLRLRIPGQWYLQFRCKTADEVVQYLADNYKVPSLYEEPSEQTTLESEKASAPKVPAKRFPLLPPPKIDGIRPAPPQQLYDPSELTYESELGDDIDAFAVARAWYGYAQEPLPEPDPELPGNNKPIMDRTRQHHAPFTTIIFRSRPPLAQSHVAQRLEEEGWFDGSGWRITEWFDKDQFSSGEPAVVGGERNWAGEAWSKAYDMWSAYGNHCGMLVSPEKLANLEQQAKRFLEARGMRLGEPVGSLQLEDLSEDQREGFQANNFLMAYHLARRSTNFEHHYLSSESEGRPETVAARKHVFDAENLRLAARNDQAEKMYRKAFDEWLEVFKAHVQFGRDSGVQEDLYEVYLRYLRLLQQRIGAPLKRTRVVGSHWGQLAGGVLTGAPDWLLAPDFELAPILSPRVPVTGPLDGTINGQPIITDDVKQMVLNRRPADKSLVPPLKVPEGPPGPPSPRMMDRTRPRTGTP